MSTEVVVSVWLGPFAAKWRFEDDGLGDVIAVDLAASAADDVVSFPWTRARSGPVYFDFIVAGVEVGEVEFAALDEEKSVYFVA